MNPTPEIHFQRSLAEITAMKMSKRISPAAWIQFSYFGGIFLLVISSTNMKKSLPPSRAGIGRRLKSPILIVMSAIIMSIELQSAL